MNLNPFLRPLSH